MAPPNPNPNPNGLLVPGAAEPNMLVPVDGAAPAVLPKNPVVPVDGAAPVLKKPVLPVAGAAVAPPNRLKPPVAGVDPPNRLDPPVDGAVDDALKLKLVAGAVPAAVGDEPKRLRAAVDVAFALLPKLKPDDGAAVGAGDALPVDAPNEKPPPPAAGVDVVFAPKLNAEDVAGAPAGGVELPKLKPSGVCASTHSCVRREREGSGERG